MYVYACEFPRKNNRCDFTGITTKIINPSDEILRRGRAPEIRTRTHAHHSSWIRSFTGAQAHRTVLYIHCRSYARYTYITAWRRTGLLVLGVWAAKGLSHPVSPGDGHGVFTYIHRSGISWTRWNMNGVLQPTNWTSSRATSPDTKAQPAAVQCVCVHYYILVQSTVQRLYPAVYPLPTTYYNIPYPVRTVSRVIAPLRCFSASSIFHRLHNDIDYNIYPDQKRRCLTRRYVYDNNTVYRVLPKTDRKRYICSPNSSTCIHEQLYVYLHNILSSVGIVLFLVEIKIK